MKTMVVTTPLRPVPTAYPPTGSLSVIKYLRRHGIQDIEFYNIDSNRPSFEDAVAYIIKANPSVLGISAVVSTAYDYTKRLSIEIKKALPKTLIVVGGNLAASAEILLRHTGTDICVLGEGEKTFLKIVNRAESKKTLDDYSDILGIAFINSLGKLSNTGYEVQIPKEEVYDFDWEELAASSDIDRFIFSPLKSEQPLSWLTHSPKASESHRLDKNIAEIHSSKGCVARCTFCHRFEKGIRYIPVDILRTRIQHLVENYNLGFLVFADENFGTDRRWLRHFCEMIEPFDLLWRVAGMRVNCITPDVLDLMKAAGCTSVVYGMETGSARMLQVMEKKTKVEQNFDAMKWTIDAGLYSIIQLVIGMPGESPDTIDETIEFCKTSLTLRKDQNSNNLSINYAQALPGTPLYEFGRREGVIPQSQVGEESYLMEISDKDAHDEFSTLNFTPLPALECQTWRPRITIEVNYAYVKKFGIEHYRKILLNDSNFFQNQNSTDGRFANPRRLIDTSIATDSVHGTKERFELSTNTSQLPGLWSLIRKGNLGLAMICYPVLIYRLRVFLPVLVFVKNLRRFPVSYSFKILREYLAFKFRIGLSAGGFFHDYKSLRRIVRDDLEDIPNDADEMAPLRQGR